MAFWQDIGFQNLMNLTNSFLESLHDLVMVWLLLILLTVITVSMGIFSSKNLSVLRLDSLVLEVTWTLIPVFILITIAMPSIFLLCTQDTFNSVPMNSIKLMSNQWNWRSEQVELIDHLVDMDKLDELSNYESPVVLPFMKVNRFLLSSSDVLHSLGIPSLGIKLDSAPGRLNAIIFDCFSLGLLTGSCYELCGSGHSAMPIYLLSC